MEMFPWEGKNIKKITASAVFFSTKVVLKRQNLLKTKAFLGYIIEEEEKEVPKWK